MKIVKKINIWLVIIVILASILRLYGLTNYPTGLNADEASIGYNAYSLIQTGKDEYGTPWPLSFKSFGDYKPGLYFYFVIPFIKVLGLTELAVRLPVALFGIGTVALIYFLAWEIFEDKATAIFSALVLAISPWSIHFSRGGWETNVAVFFITLASVFLFKSFKKKIYLFWGLLAFLISMYLYQSPRLIIPIFILALLLLYKDELKISNFNQGKSLIKSNFKLVLVYLIILIILTFPLLAQFTGGTGQARFLGLSFLGDLGPKNRINELRGEHSNPNSIVVQLIHNKITGYAPVWLGHYLDHFAPSFLFITGDQIIRDKVPEVGQFFLTESIFLIFGLIGLINNGSKNKKFILALLMVSPLASSLTFQTPNAVRSLPLVIPFSIIMGVGLAKIIKLSPEKTRSALILLILVSLGFELIHYLVSYYILYPNLNSQAWEYGFAQMVPKLEKYQGQFSKVVITDRYDQPYILVLFYEKYDPIKYQPQSKLTKRDKFNFGTVRSFDKYEFRSISPNEIQNTKSTLFIGTKDEISPGSHIIDQVLDPAGNPTFVFSSTI